jgi:hypothetical protein
MQFITMAHYFTAGILTALLVLLALIVLELKRANRIKRDEISIQLRRQFMELQTTLAANEDLSNLYQRGLRGFTGLSDTEQTRFFIISGYALTHWTEVRRHAKAGMLPQEYEQEVMNQLRDYFQYPGVQQFWQYRKHWYPQDMQTLIDNIIDNAPAQVNPLYPEPAV